MAEHEPILGPGGHVMVAEYLRSIAVNSFDNASHRSALMAELERLIVDLNSVGLVCELWINGSFVCKKETPNDVDVVLVAHAEDADSIDKNTIDAIILHLNGGKKYSPLLDTYTAFAFRREDPRFAGDGRKYWSEMWSKDRDDWLKGYAIIRLGGQDVGI